MREDEEWVCKSSVYKQLLGVTRYATRLSVSIDVTRYECTSVYDELVFSYVPV